MSTGAPEPAAVVRIERILPAPPERVFAAWTERDLLARWMSPSGRAEVEVDPRVGGRLRVVMLDAGVRIEHLGEFVVLDPPRSLRFTWISPFSGDGPSTVTVTLLPEGEGTRLLLLHERLPTELVGPHAAGWGSMLSRMAAILGQGIASGVVT